MTHKKWLLRGSRCGDVAAIGPEKINTDSELHFFPKSTKILPDDSFFIFVLLHPYMKAFQSKVN